LTGVTAIAGGRSHSLVIKNDAIVWAWGRNNSGQLGNGTNTSSNVPVQVISLTGATTIAAGEQHSLARNNNGSAWTWGSNGNGELGIGTNTNSNVPVQVNVLCPVLSINENGEQLSLSIFPNPAFTDITIESPVKGSLSILNINGRRFPEQRITMQTTTIDISSLPTGIYFVKLRSEKSIQVGKFIKQ
jgi:hypothetical protein